MRLELPFATPSNNVVMRMHHRERSAEHSRYYYLILAAQKTIARKEPFARCVITVGRYGARPLDWDNMGGGLKFLLDALVKNKIIKDDNPKCVTELNLRQIKCKRKDEKTVVVIE